MAEIFLARANGLAGFERYVVLKRIRPERDDDPRWITMFLDEARLAAQLQHPNVAQVYDLGQIGDAYFYTMEYVHGEDVLDILSRTVALGRKVPLSISLAIIAGAVQGLQYAHER
ncbi:MAG TPA: protein kinase, partial [Kofleriaceae bacterium]